MSKFETTTCGRCGGSGNYSFNLRDGTTCFGCAGSGRVLTPRGSAASAEFKRLTTVQAGEVRAGWLLFTDVAPGGRRKWRKVDEVTRDGARVNITILKATADGYPYTLCTHADADVRAVPDSAAHAAALARAMEFQASWTP